MITRPNFDLAATKALEILIEKKITETPVDPMRILKDYPGVRIIPFTKMADEIEKEREDLVPMFYTNQDAATFHLSEKMDDISYIVVYNMRLPIEIIHRAIARELGHIVLGHNGTVRTPKVRMAEAMCFAHHLLSPRPVVNMLQKSGMPFTMNVMTATLGCSDECVDDLQMIPGVNVSPELNAKVRDLFAPHIKEYINFHKASPKKDKSPVLDLGTYMDNYEE